ncbi:MAG: DUF4349 domain-containing protein [Bacteroidota bacterium]|nr:DUF4349 domain-containing protein [Bacteroidota bacterium]
MKILSIISLSAFLFLSACDNKSIKAEEVQLTELQAEDMEQVHADTIGIQSLSKYQPPEQNKLNTTILKTDWDKKIVKTANLNAEINDFNIFSKTITDKVKKWGGYISQEQQNSTEYKIENTITIKVPVEQFENAVNDLMKDAKQVNEKQVSSEDVTTEFIDSKSRLEARKQVRLQYLELLQKAKNMSEIIEVQKEINEIQEDIETVSGRINYLDHSSAMSTIQFTYFQVLDASAKTGDEGFLTRFKNAFSNGWRWLGEIVLGIIAVWPLALLAAFLYGMFKRKQLFKLK